MIPENLTLQDAVDLDVPKGLFEQFSSVPTTVLCVRLATMLSFA